MKTVHCSQCGQELPITRKALPKYGRIVDLIDPHECGEIVEPDWSIVSVPLPSSGTKKFVQKLNELQPPPKEQPLRDLRNVSDDQKSSAPETILKAIKNFET